MTEAATKAETRQEQVNTEFLQAGVEQKRETDTMEEQTRHLRMAESDVEAKRQALENRRQTVEEKREQVQVS